MILKAFGVLFIGLIVWAKIDCECARIANRMDLGC